MDFLTKLRNYAEVIVGHGLNVQPGQPVNIGAEYCHRQLVQLLVVAAYDRGASFVNVDFSDPVNGRTRILKSSADQLQYVPKFVTSKYDELLETHAANLKIVGMEFPEIFSDLDPKKINTGRIAQYQAVKRFYEDGIGKSRVHWCVAAAATPAWGQRIFKDANPQHAESMLWDEIFKICRVDLPDPILAWKEHNRTLQDRAKRLTSLKIKELHFTGPGTNLKVGLSKRAIFKGGGDVSPRGVEFEPNIPTEECFTTPDYRKTEGQVRATRPFMINGKLVEGLEAEFRAGELVDFRAKNGAETFAEYIASDPGGRRLGEVALVGIDSPIYQSGLIFEEILFDENAACHIAVGSAYKFCLSDGDSLSPEELGAIGCNESSVHTDMMISSPEVDVEAHAYDGAKVKLIHRGEWVKAI